MPRVAPDAAPAGMHGFAAALTSFVGRAGEVAEVPGLLAESRLVTLTGPGGVGKTRLAAEAARQVAGRFADGVWMVELAPVQDPALVPSALAATLGVLQVPGVSAADSLAVVLASRQLLLVLDNCEHVAGAVAELCGGLLRAADDVRVLATSREPLGVGAEGKNRQAVEVPHACPQRREDARFEKSSGVPGRDQQLRGQRASHWPSMTAFRR